MDICLEQLLWLFDPEVEVITYYNSNNISASSTLAHAMIWS